jgi:hypothetical protein
MTRIADIDIKPLVANNQIRNAADKVFIRSVLSSCSCRLSLSAQKWIPVIERPIRDLTGKKMTDGA